MTDKEAIKYLKQLYPNGGHCWLDEQRIEAIGMAIRALQKEPVSEELEEAASKYAHSITCSVAGSDIRLCGCNIIGRGFKAGAEWQKEHFEENRLKHCDSITNEQAELEQGFIDQHLDKYQRMPTYLDAIEYGMQMMNEKLMKDAIEAYIRRNKYTKKNVLNGLDVTCDAIQKFNGGDKVKVIITKED